MRNVLRKVLLAAALDRALRAAGLQKELLLQPSYRRAWWFLSITMLCLSAATQVGGRGQQVEAPPEFDAASVRQNTSTARPVFDIRGIPGGRVTITAMTLYDLIRTAWGGGLEVFGGPGWLRADRFDIAAVTAPGSVTITKLPPGAVPPPDAFKTPDRLSLMLRRLLEDRFKVRAHQETRQTPIYALVLARRDGRLGASLKPSTTECLPGAQGDSAGPARSACGIRSMASGISGTGVPLAMLAAALSRVGPIGAPVHDRTGLTGNYDFTLTFSGRMTPLDANSVSVFAALEDQLGLKLERSLGPQSVLVVDHAEHPTPN